MILLRLPPESPTSPTYSEPEYTARPCTDSVLAEKLTAPSFAPFASVTRTLVPSLSETANSRDDCGSKATPVRGLPESEMVTSAKAGVPPQARHAVAAATAAMRRMDLMVSASILGFAL